MSDFLHPLEDEFKRMIDSVFVDKHQGKSGPTKKLQLPNAPEMPECEQAQYVAVAMEELEQIRQAFLDFQDTISHFAVYPYLYPHIEQFGNIAQDLESLIENKIDEQDLTDAGIVDYEKLLQVRNRILDQIKKKHK